MIASFNQVPLILAWAITIHKSQGMSLNEANIDLRRTFVARQGYVATSCLTDISLLHFIGLSVSYLTLNASVKKMDNVFQELSRQNEHLLQATVAPEENELLDFLLKDIAHTKLIHEQAETKRISHGLVQDEPIEEQRITQNYKK